MLMMMVFPRLVCGFVLCNADFTQQYCTGITSGGTYSGTLVVTDISADMYKLDYDFSAVNCTQSNRAQSATKKLLNCVALPM